METIRLNDEIQALEGHLVAGIMKEVDGHNHDLVYEV